MTCSDKYCSIKTCAARKRKGDMMAKILSVINQKGGVGKTTTASALAAGLQRRGYRVLAVDLDAQGNLTRLFRADTAEVTAEDILTGEASAAEAICRTEHGDIIPSSKSLTRADVIMTGKGREKILVKALNDIKSDYDYIIIDTPPALGILSISALTASTGAIIPARTDLFSLDGIAELTETIDTIRNKTNSALNFFGVVITSYNGRATVNKEAADMITAAAAKWGIHTFKTRIRDCVAVKEAQVLRKNIFAHAPSSNAGRDYDRLIDEIDGGM